MDEKFVILSKKALKEFSKTQVLCLEKQVLVAQQLDVTSVWINNRTIDVLHSTNEEELASQTGQILSQAIFCTARIEDGIENLDSTLIKFVEKHQDIESLRQEYLITLSLQPSKSQPYFVTVAQRKQSSFVIFLKGNPESILQRCGTMMLHGQEEPLDLEQCKEKQDLFDDRGERMLGFCYLELTREEYPPTHSFHEKDILSKNGYCFIGFIGLKQVLLPGVKQTVNRLRNEFQLKVVMLSGDTPKASLAVARDAGIITQQITEEVQSPAVVLQDFYEMEEYEIAEKLQSPEVVAARLSPQDKVTIIHILQRIFGPHVAFYGSTLSCVPAFRQTNTSICHQSSDALIQELAQIVLLDENFSSLAGALALTKYKQHLFSKFKRFFISK